MTEPQRLGKYRLLRRIAVGGVAEVYLAVAEGAAGFEKRVVVKRLMPTRAREAGVVAMFLDEARLMALFRHPHVAEVYDIGAEGAERFFAMEHVDGCDLRDVLDEQPGEPLPLPAALAIVRAVALGLGHAHAQKDSGGQALGVVHRDVSPSNVLLGRGGEVKLVDFGVAKWTSQRSHTEHGTLKGKFAYMSPEQCRGETLDGRSDLFALGVLLYELTTGLRPFSAPSDYELMSAIVRGEFPPPAQAVPDYPAALSDVVMQALAPRPDDRFATASDLVQALDRAAGALAITVDAAAVAALLANRGPARVQTPGLPIPIGARLDQARAARPAADRTATDWSTPPPALAPAALPRARRSARLIGWGALTAAVLGAAALTWRQTHVDRSSASAQVATTDQPAATATPAPAIDARIAVDDPAVTPAASLPVAPAARPPVTERKPVRRTVGAQAPAPRPRSSDSPSEATPPAPPAAAAGTGGAGKVVWDPDSPVPP
jgi:tRNA A-37 threonylcarbamoyl transferase component Bud32